MTGKTIRQGTRVPAGWVVVSGQVSTDICNSPECVIEMQTPAASAPQAAPMVVPSSAAQVLQLTPMPSRNYAGGMGGDCPTRYDPVTGTEVAMCPDPSMPAQHTPMTANQILGRDVNTPVASAPVAPRAQPQPQPQQATMNPSQVYWAQAALAQGAAGGANRYVAPNVDAAVTRAALGAAHERAQELMALGYDYATANAQATREAFDGSGYHASGMASGVIPAATKQMQGAAQRAAENMFLREDQNLTPYEQSLFGSTPGQMFVGPGGVMYRTGSTGTAQPLAMSDAARSNPLVAAAVLSAQPGWALRNLEARQNHANAMRKLETQQQLMTDRAVTLKATPAAPRPASPQSADAAELDAYIRNVYREARSPLPYALFKQEWLAKRRAVARTAPATPTPLVAP